MNGILFIASVVVSLLCLTGIYRLLGKSGLYAWVAFACVFANIEVLKTVQCFGLETTLGNALFGTVFLATQILSEKYGEADAKKAIKTGFAIELVFILLSQIDIMFVPSETDFAHESFLTLFTLAPRVCAGSMLAFAFGNITDIYIFNRLKQIHKGKYLWLRNNASTLVSQFFDNIVFHTIAFLGPMDFNHVMILSVNVWLLEAVVALLDTPFMYLAKKINFSEATLS